MTQQSCWELTALWLSPGTIWAISSLRDNTQWLVLSSGARAPYSPRLNSQSARSHLSVLCGTMRVAPWRDRLMPNRYGGSHLLGKRAERRVRIG